VRERIQGQTQRKLKQQQVINPKHSESKAQCTLQGGWTSTVLAVPRPDLVAVSADVEVVIPGKLCNVALTSRDLVYTINSCHTPGRGTFGFRWSNQGCHFLKVVRPASQQYPAVCHE
jgi:hypothetical protein